MSTSPTTLPRPAAPPASPDAQNRATLNTILQIEKISPTHLAARIGLNSTAELQDYLATRAVSQSVKGKINRYLGTPVRHWHPDGTTPKPTEIPVETHHAAQEPSERVIRLRVPKPDPALPAGFVAVKRGLGAQYGDVPVVMIGSDLERLAISRAALKLLGNPPCVVPSINAATHELMLLPSTTVSLDAYKVQRSRKHISCVKLIRVLLDWGWSVTTPYLAEAKYGGVIVRGEDV